MQVDNNGVQARIAAEALEANKVSPKSQTKDKNAAASASGAADKLSLTSEAAQIRAMESQIAELPVVDTQRVEAVQQALATGNFQVDPAKVAEKMLNFESGLG